MRHAWVCMGDILGADVCEKSWLKCFERKYGDLGRKIGTIYAL